MHSVYIVIDENEYNFDEITFHCDPRLPRCLLQLIYPVNESEGPHHERPLKMFSHRENMSKHLV